MNIHEYQAKEILNSYKVKIQNGYVATSSEEAHELAKNYQKKEKLEFLY